MQCLYTFESDKQCGAYAIRDSEFCLNHDPSKEAKDIKRAAVIRGGYALKKNKKASLPSLPIQDQKDVPAFVIAVIRELREGALDVRTANTLGYLAGILVKAYEIIELAGRLEKIETLVLERKTYRA